MCYYELHWLFKKDFFRWRNSPQWAKASRSHTDTRHSVGLLWASDQAEDDALTCTTCEDWNFNSGNYLFTTDTK